MIWSRHLCLGDEHPFLYCQVFALWVFSTFFGTLRCRLGTELIELCCLNCGTIGLFIVVVFGSVWWGWEAEAFGYRSGIAYSLLPTLSFCWETYFQRKYRRHFLIESLLMVILMEILLIISFSLKVTWNSFLSILFHFIKVETFILSSWFVLRK